MPLVEQILLIFPEFLSSPPGFSRVRLFTLQFSVCCLVILLGGLGGGLLFVLFFV